MMLEGYWQHGLCRWWGDQWHYWPTTCGWQSNFLRFCIDIFFIIFTGGEIWLCKQCLGVWGRPSLETDRFPKPRSYWYNDFFTGLVSNWYMLRMWEKIWVKIWLFHWQGVKLISVGGRPTVVGRFLYSHNFCWPLWVNIFVEIETSLILSPWKVWWRTHGATSPLFWRPDMGRFYLSVGCNLDHPT